jgi:hypothetical protein
VPTAGEVVEVMVAGTFTAWFLVEALAIWAQRPPVVFVDGHWRAQRGMERRRYPISHVAPPRYVPRLRVVDDLAS